MLGTYVPRELLSSLPPHPVRIFSACCTRRGGETRAGSVAPVGGPVEPMVHAEEQIHAALRATLRVFQFYMSSSFLSPSFFFVVCHYPLLFPGERDHPVFLPSFAGVC